MYSLGDAGRIEVTAVDKSGVTHIYIKGDAGGSVIADTTAVLKVSVFLPKAVHLKFTQSVFPDSPTANVHLEIRAKDSGTVLWTSSQLAGSKGAVLPESLYVCHEEEKELVAVVEITGNPTSIDEVYAFKVEVVEAYDTTSFAEEEIVAPIYGVIDENGNIAREGSYPLFSLEGGACEEAYSAYVGVNNGESFVFETPWLALSNPSLTCPHKAGLRWNLTFFKDNSYVDDLVVTIESITKSADAALYYFSKDLSYVEPDSITVKNQSQGARYFPSVVAFARLRIRGTFHNMKGLPDGMFVTVSLLPQPSSPVFQMPVEITDPSAEFLNGLTGTLMVPATLLWQCQPPDSTSCDDAAAGGVRWYCAFVNAEDLYYNYFSALLEPGWYYLQVGTYTPPSPQNLIIYKKTGHSAYSFSGAGTSDDVRTASGGGVEAYAFYEDKTDFYLLHVFLHSTSNCLVGLKILTGVDSSTIAFANFVRLLV